MREIPAEVEDYRDVRWWREGDRAVGTAADAERFVDAVGFAACLTDSRRPGPSLYMAVCGRRDAVKPRNVQTDEETSLAWTLKDDLMRRGRVYYGKLARGPMFLAPRMIPFFHAIWGRPVRRLSPGARRVHAALSREWEMGTSDLRAESGVTDRRAFTAALDELQAAMLVVPSEVVYAPFTYIWTLAVGRFPDALGAKVSVAEARREIARCFLTGAGMTFPGELARITGLTRAEAGLANRALVAEGMAEMPARGTYRLKTFSGS